MTRWRDIGGGMIRDEISGREIPFAAVRPRAGHTITLAEAEWTKLVALAERRSTPKNPKTPEQCVRDFIASCVVENTWEHPLHAAAKHQAKT